MKVPIRRVDGVVQGYHVLGRGHSAEVCDVGKGKVLKRFLGQTHASKSLERDIEFKNYVKLGLQRFAVIVPLKWTQNGLEMPKLRVITRSALPGEYKKHGFLFVESRNISDSQVRALWRGLRELSKAGIESQDVLHVGIGNSGKPYFFDVAGFTKTNVVDAELANEAYWETFAKKIGRDDLKVLFPEKPTVQMLIDELNGKKVWSGLVDLRDGVVEKTFTKKQAKDMDHHHSFLVSGPDDEAIRNGEKAYFWIEKGVPMVMENNLSPRIKARILEQVGDRI